MTFVQWSLLKIRIFSRRPLTVRLLDPEKRMFPIETEDVVDIEIKLQVELQLSHEKNPFL